MGGRVYLISIAILIHCVLMPPSPLAGPAGAAGSDTAPAKDLTGLGLEELMQVEVETVYSASKFEQKVTEAPSSVTIVTADEIRKYGYRTLADILRAVRSFSISYDRNYDYAGIRGFGRWGDYNSRILLLVDGHRINDNLYDTAPLGTEFVVDVDLIERVEIIRGPGSSLYGSNAFFAVINVITKQGEEIGGGEVSGETGSFDSYKGRLTYGKGFASGVDALVSGSYYNSIGDRLFFPEFNDPAYNNGVTDHTDYDRSYNTLARFSYRDFTLEGVYSSRTKGIPTAVYGTDFNDRRNRATDEWWYLDLKYERELGERVDVMGRLFYDSYVFDGDYVYGGVVEKDVGHGNWWGGEAKVGVQLFDSHRLVAGTEYRDNFHQNLKTFYVNPYAPIVDSRRNSSTWAIYLQDEYTVIKELLLNVGLRYDNYGKFGGTVNPRLALIYTPFGGTAFKIIYGSAFRIPNVYESYYQDGISQIANPALRPEKIKTYELVCEQYFGSHFRVSLTGFYYSIDDLIEDVVISEDGISQFRNLSNAEADGVEAELEGKWENGWTARASYSFQDAWDSGTGLTLVNSPRNLAKLNVIAPLLRDKVFLGIEEQFTDRRRTIAGNYAKAYFITNLTLFSRNLLDNLELSASVYNLFDYRYGDPGGLEHVQDVIQQDGRTFRVKLTYRF